jgi:hypothetical protein
LTYEKERKRKTERKNGRDRERGRGRGKETIYRSIGNKKKKNSNL